MTASFVSGLAEDRLVNYKKMSRDKQNNKYEEMDPHPDACG